VTSSRPIAGGADEWKLDLAGSKTERDEAMEFAKRFANGWLHNPTK
jgi:hypothetical protein